MTEKAELLPCPFCGGIDLNEVSNGECNAFIECEDCGASGPAGIRWVRTDGWNTRHLPESVEKELTQAREEVERLKGAVDNGGYDHEGNHLMCLDCWDSGWNEDREDRSPCTCVSETEPYQMMENTVEFLWQIIDDIDTKPTERPRGNGLVT